MRYAWFGLAIVVACGSGEDDARLPAAPDSLAGASSTGGNKSPTKPGGDAGAGGDAAGSLGGASSQGGEGGAIVYETAGQPSFPAGVCDPAMAPGHDEALELAVSDVRLLSMTPDELSVAFVTGSGAETALYVADRSASNEAFTEQLVAVPAGFEATSGVSLSSDGTQLILVKQDHSGFGQLLRPDRGEPFAADADESRFAFLNMLFATTGRMVGWPVLASDGETLYYVTYPAWSLVVQSSADADGVFTLGVEIDEFTLGGDEGEFRFLTGISVDQRAIFFQDEATGHAMALFRQYEDAPFYDLLDLGEREGVAPNESCSRLYSSVGGGVVLQPIE